ncbi:MAG: acyltransferase [Solobacterium sp.]|nr:acyltransferase [Solobacterium sp.]
MASTNIKKNHIHSFDLIRIIAILMVLFNHTNKHGFTLYTFVRPGVSYWLSIGEAVLCKAAVPLFMMVSGSLLLKKKESVKETLQRRVLPFTIILCVMYFLQYLRLIRAQWYTSFSIRQYISFLFGENPIVTYWFLRTYLIYLICLPILRLFAQNMTDDVFKLFFGIKAVLSLLSIIEIAADIPVTLSVPLTDDFIIFPIFGYWIFEHRNNKFKADIPVLLGVLLAASVFAHTMYQSKGIGEACFTPFVWLISVVLFHSIVLLEFKNDHPALKTVGGCVFGIYLIEDIVRNRLMFLFPLLTPIITELGAANVFVAAVFGVALVIIVIGKKIPVIRFFLR